MCINNRLPQMDLQKRPFQNNYSTFMNKQENPFHRLNFCSDDAALSGLNDFLSTEFGYPLTIKYSPSAAGLYLVASRDISPGEVILRECPVSLALDDKYTQEYCGICCTKLSMDECKSWLSVSSKSRNDPASILCEECASNNYVVDLNNFLHRNRIQLVNCDNDSKRKECDARSLYSIFFRLFLGYGTARGNSLDDNVVNLDLRAACMLAYDSSGSLELINDIMNIADLLSPHLVTEDYATHSQIVALCRILVCNQHTVYTSGSGGVLKEIGRALCPAAALFNHSCSPNVEWTIGPNSRGIMICTAKQDIKCGDVLTISYAQLSAFMDEPKKRRRYLMDKMDFLCSCTECRKHCSNCSKANCSLSTCSRCKSAWYCSKQCQLDDWSQQHKHDCKKQSLSKMCIE